MAHTMVQITGRIYLQDRFNSRSLRLSHYITCWPMLANIAENLPHGLHHIFVSFKDNGCYHSPENESPATVISGQSCHWSVLMKHRRKSSAHFGCIVTR